ncbi:hypothetical protein [Streptomyces sp. NPDC058424]|uniref:hypothetical protein n=1 Tax=Streptomyces sp. NPDC058424 TaxID=3346491 RepID=UPI00364846DA
MLLARSRHASVRSLERYARPGVDAVAAHVAVFDPAAPPSGLITAPTAHFRSVADDLAKPQSMLFGDIMSSEFRIMTVVRPDDT